MIPSNDFLEENGENKRSFPSDFQIIHGRGFRFSFWVGWVLSLAFLVDYSRFRVKDSGGMVR